MSYTWSDFTKNNLNKINELKKIYVNDESLIVKKAREEREEIFKLKDINFTISNFDIPKDKLIKYASTYWVYNKVIDKLDELSGSYLISWVNNNLTNRIYIKCMPHKLENIKSRINILLKVINRIQLKSKKKLGIEMYLVLSDLKKKLDNNKKIDPKHVNSGYTDTEKNFIFIWRDEEFEKVSFHELIHFFDMDHRHEEIHEEHEDFQDNSIYEAITDFKAIFYNIIYISICTGKSIISLFNLEITFINNQAKLIKYNIDTNTNIILNSPVYSYFIIKSLLYNYINNLNQINFEKIWTDLFINNINFNKIINNIKNEEIKLETNYHDFNSARMTSLELI
jgi:hypothetical protein